MPLLPSSLPTNILMPEQDRPGKSQAALDRCARVPPLTDHSTKLQFSFANYAEDFDRHIEHSIRGYGNLIEDCVELSQYFVENNTVACDIGCATGRTLVAIRDRNQERAPAANYIGLDIEPSFQEHWKRFADANIQFLLQDVVLFEDFRDLSLATAIFTLQFLPQRHRLEVSRKIYDHLVPGGALVVAEKFYAKTPKIQDMLTSLYLHYKRQYFSDEEILDKEKSLRNIMKPGREDDLIQLLTEAGFKSENIECFWRSHLFAAFVCIKL
jgi:tRNA (cmo5U34)-methyltransferase